jgi:hypothetical protein
MRKIVLFLGAVLLVACSDTPSAPSLERNAKVANECAWYRSGDGDSVLVCNDPK